MPLREWTEVQALPRPESLAERELEGDPRLARQALFGKRTRSAMCPHGGGTTFGLVTHHMQQIVADRKNQLLRAPFLDDT